MLARTLPNTMRCRQHCSLPAFAGTFLFDTQPATQLVRWMHADPTDRAQLAETICRLVVRTGLAGETRGCCIVVTAAYLAAPFCPGKFALQLSLSSHLPQQLPRLVRSIARSLAAATG